jgi:hypothetical protein
MLEKFLKTSLKTSLKIGVASLLFGLFSGLMVVGGGSPILGFLGGGLLAFATYKIGKKVFEYITKDSNPHDDVSNSRGQAQNLNQAIGVDLKNLTEENLTEKHKSVPIIEIISNSPSFTDLQGSGKNQQNAGKYKQQAVKGG